MNDTVRRKLEQRKVADPEGRAADPWAAFRDIEILDLPLEFRFRHTLGKTSRFFLALEEKRLLATRCPHCGTTWMPPRAVCGHDRTITEWVELSGRATLAAATVCGPQLGGTTLGYVALEGATTLLFHPLRHVAPGALIAGLPLKIVWSADPVDHPMQSFWFEPD